MTVYAITDTKKGRTGIAPTYLQVGAGAAFSNTATWTGSCPRAWTATSYKMHPIRWNRLPHWCLQVFISSKDSNSLTDWNALPASTRAKQSTDSFKKALHKFPDTPCWPLPSRATPAVTADHPSLDTDWRTEAKITSFFRKFKNK